MRPEHRGSVLKNFILYVVKQHANVYYKILKIIEDYGTFIINILYTIFFNNLINNFFMLYTSALILLKIILIITKRLIYSLRMLSGL